MDLLDEMLLRKHAQELRDTWQGRALAHAKGRMAAVVLSVLAHSYRDAIATLLMAVFPGFRSIALPFYSSAGHIMPSGHIAADMMVTKDHELKKVEVFKSELDMQTQLRRLADELKLSDTERIEMFKIAKRWIVCDHRAPVSGAELDDRINR